MSSASRPWTDYFLPKGEIVSVEELKKYRLLIFVCYLTSLLALCYLIVSVVVRFRAGVATMAVSVVVTFCLPFLVRRGANRRVIANVYIGLVFLVTVIVTSFNGGLSLSVTSAYIAIVPLLAMLLVDQRTGFIWLVVVFVELLVLGVAELSGVDFPMTFSIDFDPAFKLAAFGGLVAIVFFSVRDFDATTQSALHQVQEERKKSEDLLLNILPAEVAEELKATGAAEAREFDAVTILFSDFRNFTEISSGMTPQDLVAELNECFYAFDAIIGAHNLEKIKTIGDAYMAAAGLPHEGDSEPIDMIKAGIEMQAFLASHNAELEEQGSPSFEMRVGIHTGPVVAGIVGIAKFQYDVWGDTVNVASRMESSGEAGSVNISEATYDLVRHEPTLVFTPRRKVAVKGKGEMGMYFVKLADTP
jgi:class 3 adenylate cyclase